MIPFARFDLRVCPLRGLRAPPAEALCRNSLWFFCFLRDFACSITDSDSEWVLESESSSVEESMLSLDLLRVCHFEIFFDGAIVAVEIALVAEVLTGLGPAEAGVKTLAEALDTLCVSGGKGWGRFPVGL